MALFGYVITEISPASRDSSFSGSSEKGGSPDKN
jgi:hypothetical protein